MKENNNNFDNYSNATFLCERNQLAVKAFFCTQGFIFMKGID